MRTTLSRHGVGTYQRTEFAYKLSGKARSQWFQLVEPLWTDPGRKGGIWARKLISVKKLKSSEKVQAGNDSSNLPSKSPLMLGKTHHHLFLYFAKNACRNLSDYLQYARQAV